MNPVTKGAHSEIVAAAWLMRQGYQVFRALSPAAPFDLVACDTSGNLIRVEVRSANKAGMLPRYKGKFDLLLVVLPDGIVYGRQKTLDIPRSGVVR